MRKKDLGVPSHLDGRVGQDGGHTTEKWVQISVEKKRKLNKSRQSEIIDYTVHNRYVSVKIERH